MEAGFLGFVVGVPQTDLLDAFPFFFFLSGQPESKKQSTNISEMENNFLVRTTMSDSQSEIYDGPILAENMT